MYNCLFICINNKLVLNFKMRLFDLGLNKLIKRRPYRKYD